MGVHVLNLYTYDKLSVTVQYTSCICTFIRNMHVAVSVCGLAAVWVCMCINLRKKKTHCTHSAMTNLGSLHHSVCVVIVSDGFQRQNLLVFPACAQIGVCVCVCVCSLQVLINKMHAYRLRHRRAAAPPVCVRF